MLGGARCVYTVSLVSTPGISTEELYSLVKDWSYEDMQAARRPEMDLGHDREMAGSSLKPSLSSPFFPRVIFSQNTIC